MASRDVTQHHKEIAKFQKSKGLGRLPAADPRDHAHLMMHLVIAPPERTSKTWAPGVILDQGATPRCVAYAWTGFLLATPLRTKDKQLDTMRNLNTYAGALYAAAQKVDEWPGEGYDGTSVRAGAKVLQDEQKRLGEYVWAFDAATLRDYVLTRGPAVIGINWYETMFAPTAKGYLLVDGPVAGGHAILVIGYSKARTAFRLLNSWGKGWGEKGRAWIRASDMERLLKEDGEACSAIEVVP
jgi:hypothetical protein